MRYTESHEGLREIDHFLTLCSDSERSDREISALLDQLSHDAAPASAFVRAVIAHCVQLVLELCAFTQCIVKDIENERP